MTLKCALTMNRDNKMYLHARTLSQCMVISSPDSATIWVKIGSQSSWPRSAQANAWRIPTSRPWVKLIIPTTLLVRSLVGVSYIKVSANVLLATLIMHVLISSCKDKAVLLSAVWVSCHLSRRMNIEYAWCYSGIATIEGEINSYRTLARIRHLDK